MYRWFASVENRNVLRLVSIQFVPEGTYNGLYRSSCGRIWALRHFLDGPDPAASVQYNHVVHLSIF